MDEAAKPSEFDGMFSIPGLDQMLLFSSDYPHYDTDSPDLVLGRIPEHMKDAVSWRNAVDAFGLRSSEEPL
jgi:predicted TIM-barrel fold metal-dependent hydrolase